MEDERQAAAREEHKTLRRRLREGAEKHLPAQCSGRTRMKKKKYFLKEPEEEESEESAMAYINFC